MEEEKLKITEIDKTRKKVNKALIFKFSKVGNIAGSHVKSGSVKIGSLARLIRDGVVVANTKIKSLQREKDQVKEVNKDMDCGLTLENYQDIHEGDIVEVFTEVEVK